MNDMTPKEAVDLLKTCHLEYRLRDHGMQWEASLNMLQRDAIAALIERMAGQLDEASKVYCAVTNGALSKTNYTADTIIRAYEDDVTATVADETKELRARLARLKAELNAALQVCSESEASCERLHRQVEAHRTLLGECRHEIWQTARVNQLNLTGIDPVFPKDKPCKEAIGKTAVRQVGIDGALKVVSRIDAALAEEEGT